MIEDNTLLLYGVSMNKSRDYDDEYLANMTGKKPQNRQPTSSLEPLPLKEIREALTYQDPAEEPESQAYIRARVEDKAVCSLCNDFTHWNRALLAIILTSCSLRSEEAQSLQASAQHMQRHLYSFAILRFEESQQLTWQINGHHFIYGQSVVIADILF
jgi:hypothetical protein